MSRSNLILSLTVLAVTLLVVPGIASQKCRKGGLCEKPSTIDDDVWTVHFGPVNDNLQYVDPLSGEVKGHYVDILNAVCEIANKSCKPVYDVSSNCWDTVDDGGQVGGFGVFNFYYDACTGWLPTYGRLRTFQFSESLVKNKGSSFIVKPGNPDSFDPSDLTGKTIGFIDGFFSDPGCVARNDDSYANGAEIPPENIIYYADLTQLIAAIVADEVDAGFDSAKIHDGIDYLEDSAVFCAVGGAAMLMRKDNLMKSWFDPALEMLTTSPEYEVQYDTICNDIQAVHGDLPGADREDICI